MAFAVLSAEYIMAVLITAELCDQLVKAVKNTGIGMFGEH